MRGMDNLFSIIVFSLRISWIAYAAIVWLVTITIFSASPEIADSFGIGVRYRGIFILIAGQIDSILYGSGDAAKSAYGYQTSQPA